MGASARRVASALAGLTGALLACGLWSAGPEGTPTPQIGSDGPRYTSAPAPAAYLLLDPIEDVASLFSVDGRLIEEFTDLLWWVPREASGAAATPLLAPDRSTQIAFLRSGPEGVTLNLRQGQDDHALLSLRDPAGLCGSIPAGYLAVSDVLADEETGSLFSAIYVLEAATGAGSEEPVLRLTTLRTAPQPLPIAIRLLGDAPSTVYYTLTTFSEAPGGGVESRGLFMLDLTTRAATPFIDPSNRVLGISPDLTFVAFYSAERTPPEIRLARLDGASTVLFQPLSGAREVRSAVFSPDSSRLAWDMIVPGSGGEASFLLSLASTFGGPATVMDLTRLLLTGQGPTQWAYPVAWLTDSVLLIQVEGSSSSAVYRYDLETGELSAPAAGMFITLLYP